MLEGIWGAVLKICMILCWIAPFTFVFFLVYTVKEAVNKGRHDIEYALGASVSLLIIVAACVLS